MAPSGNTTPARRGRGSAQPLPPERSAANGAAEPARNVVQVIGRAAAILRALEGTHDGLSLAQIAQRVGLPRSTVQRIAAALEAEQLLVAASPAGGLRLGPSLLRLAASVPTEATAIIRPLIERLSADLGETVDLACLRKDRLVFLDQIVGSHRLRAVSAIGDSFPLHCSANGKAALAGMPDAAIERLIGRNWPSRTPHTLTTLDALLQNLATVRRTGIGLDRQEHTLGICAAGIAAADMLGNVVAISVPVPVDRFRAQETAITAALARTRTDLALLMGR